MIERHAVLQIDCDECDKVETLYLETGTPLLPENWIQVNEGPPFYKNFDFCSSECFMKWHQGDKEKRIKKVYDKQHKRDDIEKQRRETTGQTGPMVRKIKKITFEEG